MDTELNNQEEQYGQVPEQTAPVVEQEEAPANPTDLAEAFAMLRGNDNGSAQDNVVPQTGGRGPESGVVPESSEGSGVQAAIPAQQPATVGGSSVDLSGFDPQNATKQIIAGIRQQVIRDKAKEWNDKGYKKFTVRDLARKDEHTGRIFYINPNDTQEDWERGGYQGFTMEQAKTWVDITNEELNDQWKKECLDLERQYMNRMSPYLNLVAYANTYNSLNDTEKMFVDEMTEPYAIYDNSGNVVGFNCDLNKVTSIAKNMATRFASQATAQSVQNTNNVRQPATDARSSAGTSKGGMPKINDLNDAFTYLWEKERQEGK